MSKLSRRKRMLLYKLIVLILLIVAVWVISPLTSDNFEWTSFEFWHRVFVTIFYGAWLTGLIDTRSGLEWMKRYRRPYVYPHFVYVAMAIVIPSVMTIPMALFNMIFLASLFRDILSYEIGVLISIVLGAFLTGYYGIVYYHIFDEWYKELNG